MFLRGQPSGCALVSWSSLVAINEGLDVTIRFLRAGHILGSSLVLVESQGKRIVFSGDVGRQNDVIMNPPVAIPPCDYLVLESTYGDRLHSGDDPREHLAAIITRTIQRGGILLIPSFAVGRAQAIIYLIADLMAKDMIPELPIFLDSPMSVDASRLFCEYPDEHRISDSACKAVFSRVTYVRDVQDSIVLSDIRYPHIIISASGMATGGRVLHHLKRLLPDDNNSVLFVGYQPTRITVKCCSGCRPVRGWRRASVSWCTVKRRLSITSEAESTSNWGGTRWCRR